MLIEDRGDLRHTTNPRGSLTLMWYPPKGGVTEYSFITLHFLLECEELSRNDKRDRVRNKIQHHNNDTDSTAHILP